MTTQDKWERIARCFIRGSTILVNEKYTSQRPIWTDEVPKEPGAYWWRHAPGRIVIIRTVYAAGEHKILKANNFPWPIESLGGQWSTRIPEPKEE